jgi:2-methylcitrate dehydratase PrpD
VCAVDAPAAAAAAAGVARSIESDVDNLMRLISIANILPKGMYVENAVKVNCSRESCPSAQQGLLHCLSAPLTVLNITVHRSSSMFMHGFYDRTFFLPVAT